MSSNQQEPFLIKQEPGSIKRELVWVAFLIEKKQSLGLKLLCEVLDKNS